MIRIYASLTPNLARLQSRDGIRIQHGRDVGAIGKMSPKSQVPPPTDDRRDGPAARV